MEYILLGLIFILLGICLMACVSINRISDLERQNNDLEFKIQNRERFILQQGNITSKYYEIVSIVREDEKKNEFAVITVNKIKEVTNDRKSINNF